MTRRIILLHTSSQARRSSRRTSAKLAVTLHSTYDPEQGELSGRLQYEYLRPTGGHSDLSRALEREWLSMLALSADRVDQTLTGSLQARLDAGFRFLEFDMAQYGFAEGEAATYRGQLYSLLFTSIVDDFADRGFAMTQNGDILGLELEMAVHEPTPTRAIEALNPPAAQPGLTSALRRLTFDVQPHALTTGDDEQAEAAPPRRRVSFAETEASSRVPELAITGRDDPVAASTSQANLLGPTGSASSTQAPSRSSHAPSRSQRTEPSALAAFLRGAPPRSSPRPKRSRVRGTRDSSSGVSSATGPGHNAAQQVNAASSSAMSPSTRVAGDHGTGSSAPIGGTAQIYDATYQQPAQIQYDGYYQTNDPLAWEHEDPNEHPSELFTGVEFSRY